MSTPIFKAEQCHTGGSLCRHTHRTIRGATRCLPAAPRAQGTYSLARVIPMNSAARQLLDAAVEEDIHAAYN